MIDGKGKTLVPGLWDSHQHISDDASGPMLLSLGITSIRDPGNVNALTIARAARRAKAELLSPHVYPSVLIDGKGANTAQAGSVATSQDEAIAIVRKAKADGFIAIKFYGTFDPAVGAPPPPQRRIVSACTCTDTFRPVCARPTRSPTATTRSRTSTS